jgi:quinol monooxygenase YgiN
MVYVSASITIQDGKRDEFLSIVKELVEKTNELDAGCIRYELCVDVGNENQFYMVEQWESEQALDAHMKAAHFVNLIPKIGPLTSSPDKITVMAKVF